MKISWFIITKFYFISGNNWSIINYKHNFIKKKVFGLLLIMKNYFIKGNIWPFINYEMQFDLGNIWFIINYEIVFHTGKYLAYYLSTMN